MPDVEPVDPVAPPLRGPVLMHQQWRDLSMLHWAVDPELVADRMPRGVRPDVHEGRTYVGLVPFRMVDASPGRLPPTPWLGTFLETNVRLYSVDTTGRRGVVFLSLDCDRLAVTLGARLAFGTPYRWARMRHAVSGPPDEAVHTYEARLRWPGARGRSRVVLRDRGPREPTDLDHFLSARWGLHTSVLGVPTYVPNEHGPWPVHAADLLELDDDLLASVGFPDLARRPPDHVLHSPGVTTEFGLPGRAARPRVVPGVDSRHS